MPILHLIYGFTGAGKTTFAKKLEQDTGAVRFSPDEWMVRQYGHNPPEEKFREYERAIIDLIYQKAAERLEEGRDVILDMGFWSRAARDKARHFGKTHRAEIKLYALTCSEEEMMKRVLARTSNLPFGELVIDRNAIEQFKKRFEPLQPDEEHVLIHTASF